MRLGRANVADGERKTSHKLLVAVELLAVLQQIFFGVNYQEMLDGSGRKKNFVRHLLYL
jgi:hypothetical protein